jgi:hypothetical protein
MVAAANTDLDTAQLEAEHVTRETSPAVVGDERECDAIVHNTSPRGSTIKQDESQPPKDTNVQFLYELNDFDPTEEEVESYAKYLGIDPANDPDLMQFARDGIMARLPDGWKACKGEKCDSIFYRNEDTGETSWEHPADRIFMALVHEIKTGVRERRPDWKLIDTIHEEIQYEETFESINAPLPEDSDECLADRGLQERGNDQMQVGSNSIPRDACDDFKIHADKASIAAASCASTHVPIPDVEKKEAAMPLSLIGKVRTNLTVASIADFAHQRYTALPKTLRETAANQEVQVTALAATGGAVTVGATCGAAGLLCGSAIGAVVGVIPAIFTFGLSIPVGAAIGGGVGLTAGATAGAGAGFVSGGVAGYGVYKIAARPRNRRFALESVPPTAG